MTRTSNSSIRRRTRAGTWPDAELLRGMLHDLGHQLATLSYLVAAVRADPDLTGDSQHRVELLERGIARLADMARPRAAGGGSAPVGVQDLLTEVVALSTLPPATDVVITADPELVVWTDGRALCRIMHNLVDNALRAASSGGRVDIRAAIEDGRTFIEVADDGPGFGRCPAGWAAMGLEIVWQLAETCGADVRIQARRPHGTRVRLTFEPQRELESMG